jgi:hypothetical protein
LIRCAAERWAFASATAWGPPEKTVPEWEFRLRDARLGNASALETHNTTNNTAIAIRIITPFSFGTVDP